MVRDVEFVLLLCVSFAFTHGNPYNLNGNKKDACFQPSQKATAECLQGLLESYYDTSFSQYCPEYAQILAEWRCTGCPWDRLDPSKINPDIAKSYHAASNFTELFHEPHANCTTSRYVAEFGTYQGVLVYAYGWAFLGSIPILFSTGAIVQYTSDYDGSTRARLLGTKVDEWMFMGAAWISFNAGAVILSMSEVYYVYCDMAASNLALVMARYLSYVVLVYYSLRRCRRLRFAEPEDNQVGADQSMDSLNASNETRRSLNSNTSWYTFVWHKEGRSLWEYIQSKKFVGLCISYAPSVAIPFLCIFQFFGARFINCYQGGGSICSLDWADTMAGVIAMSELAFEPLVYAVYSYGASTRNKVAYCVRYAVLALIAVYCVAVLCLIGSKSLSRPNGSTFLFMRVPLQRAASEINLIYVVAVSLLGLLEPLRYGSIYLKQG